MAENFNDDVLVEAATIIGSNYGMSATDVLAHILVGDQRHPDADEDVCGMASLRDSRLWCGREPHHRGDHIPTPPRGATP